MKGRKSSSGRSKSSPARHTRRRRPAKAFPGKKARPSQVSKMPAEGLPKADGGASEALPDRRTLEEELISNDFATRGLDRLVDLADYFAHLVDGRTTGLLATDNPKTF